MPIPAKKATASPDPEEILRESEQRFRLMSDTAPVMIWMSGTTTLCTYFNKVWLDFTGRTMEQELGNGWAEGVHPDDFERCLTIYTTSFDQRKPFSMEYRIRRYDGVYRWILDNGVPRFTPNGAFAGYIGSGIDITELKEANQRKDEFISMASHELKTPVTSIKTFTQALSYRFQKQGDEECLRILSRMDAQLDKLTKLISDLLDIAKIQTGKLTLREEAFALDELVVEIVDMLQGTTRHQLLLEQRAPVLVFGDQDRIGQVLINLLTNAIMYSPQADKVAICLEKEQGNVVVSVQDFGIGIAEDQIEKIFEQFYQAADPLEKTYPGLGIGLYISSEIIKQHHGRIWVQSKKGAGSTFMFCLPVYEESSRDLD
ncbi:MAG TPA: PAS domain-containing sensor histidine kinase [Ktedonosporobacter sp.]|nr:PAS domain-containing sensor histidine kinase [Ktedonosporobacter sp.]